MLTPGAWILPQYGGKVNLAAGLALSFVPHVPKLLRWYGFGLLAWSALELFAEYSQESTA